jgi:hypothetical protein
MRTQAHKQVGATTVQHQFSVAQSRVCAFASSVCLSLLLLLLLSSVNPLISV